MKTKLLFLSCLFLFACDNGTPGDNGNEAPVDPPAEYECAPGVIDVAYTPCKDKQVTEVLNRVPVIVRRHNVFQTEGDSLSIRIQAECIDTFAFELTRPCTMFLITHASPLISRYRVPEEYRVDGMQVLVSGDVTDCYVSVSAPDIKTLPLPIFELRSIVKNETVEEPVDYERAPGVIDVIYAPCKDKQVTEVLDQYPAIVRQHNVFQTDGDDLTIYIQAANIDTFAFELPVRYAYSGYPTFMISRYRVPEAYRVDGLEVAISGDVTNCFVSVGSPTRGVLPVYLFELTDIIKRETE
ncbi:MAG: hypothetical protein LBH61_07965 [Dysgonamonadaceae bacterium]|jgi:hypothetical protein|nr:hypothetical protein [Dysgonamonadaceae bacterium]